MAIVAGCQRVNQRTEPVVTTPPRTMPAQDVPPIPEREDTYIETSAEPKFRPAVPDEDKAALLYHAKLDLLRMLVCSEEQVQLSSERYNSDELLQIVCEHFTDIGFRVIDGSPCPAYSSSVAALNVIANERDVDMFVLLMAKSLRKSARGALLRRISVDGLNRAEQVDYVRVGLSKKPGIQSVALSSWDKQTGRVIFWVRLDASVKENLAAYLEEIDNVKLKVERLDKTGVESREKRLLEF